MTDNELSKVLNFVLKRFIGMEFNRETLSYMEMEINDMLGRVYPEKKKHFHIEPYMLDKRIKFRTHYLQ